MDSFFNWYEKYKITRFLFVSRKTTPRAVRLFAFAILGVFLLIWYKDNCYVSKLIDVRNFQSFQLFILSFPVAVALWVFRNNDKLKDHEHFNINIRKDQENKTMESLSTLIERMLGKAYDVKNEKNRNDKMHKPSNKKLSYLILNHRHDEQSLIIAEPSSEDYEKFKDSIPYQKMCEYTSSIVITINNFKKKYGIDSDLFYEIIHKDLIDKLKSWNGLKDENGNYIQ